MEDGNNGANTASDAQAIVPFGDNKNVSIKSHAKKKRGGLNLLRAAMHMLHRRPSTKKSKPLYAEVASAEVLNKVVCSIRPLHAQSNESPPHAVAPATFVVVSFPSPPEQFEDLPQSPVAMIVPPSPDHSSSSSDGVTSRYASALNLQDLDTVDDDEDENKGNHNDNGIGDEMIDLKAEEFIAQFYEQMRIQNQNEMDRRRNKHHHRHHDHHELSHVRRMGWEIAEAENF